MTGHIKNELGQLSYVTSGSGEKVLFAFHGFGQNKEQFIKILRPWEPYYTIYAFDLPFHGDSNWPSIGVVLKPDWFELLQNFISEKQIKKFSLLGFSMGGRFVLATLELFLSKIDLIHFIAPDGFKQNFWYKLATHNSLTRSIFKYVSYHPKALFVLIDLMDRSRLMNAGLIKFVRGELRDSEERIRVYHSWVGIRHLKFNLSEILQLIEKYEIETFLFLGSRDRVIKKEYFSSIINSRNSIKIKVVDSGHQHVMSLSVKNWHDEYEAKS
ncbi:MAG: alpha/beta fold hydrolase [Bacteroidota bacterium]